MSWEHDLFALLDDLERQAAALYEADREAELADRAAAEYGAVTLASRLMASRRAARWPSTCRTSAGRGTAGAGRGRSGACSRGPAQDWIVRLRAVTGVRGA